MSTSFGLSPDRFAAVNNCALGMVYLNSPLPFDASDAASASPNVARVAVMCVACRPGFRPRYAVVDGRAAIMVAECVQIIGCRSGSTRINGCQECEANYALNYDESVGIDYSLCSPDSDANCYARASGAQRCKICRKGYAANHGGVCEPIAMRNCSAADAEVLESFAAQDIEHFLLYNRTNGCTSCFGASVPVLLQTSAVLCVRYTLPGIAPAYPPHCQNYARVNGSILCALCEPGYIVNRLYRCVVAGSQMENCTMALTSRTCAACEDGYQLFGGLCDNPVALNCERYQPHDSSKCIKCADGFARMGDFCVEGVISGCRTYDTISVCLACMQGHALMRYDDGSQTCVKVTASIDRCVESTFVRDSALAVGCSRCESNYFPQRLQRPTVFCQPYLLDQNCVSVIGSTIRLGRTPLCAKCAADYKVSPSKR